MLCVSATASRSILLALHEPHTDSFLVTVVVVRRACLAVAHSSRHVVVAAAGDGTGAGGGGVALAVYMHRDPV